MNAPTSASQSLKQTPRPMLRGTMHGLMALLAPAGLVLLLLLADSPRGYVGAAIYATSVILLYTSSASYHLIPWSSRLRSVAKRIDHSMIFVLIAGTYTPFCLILVGDAWGIPLLAIVWTLAGLGTLVKVAWPYGPPWLSVALYVGMGWIGIVAVWPVATTLHPLGIGLLMLGGLLYTIGSVSYATRWPNPVPRLFGYHEIFHVFVVAGSLVHFVLIAIYLL